MAISNVPGDLGAEIDSLHTVEALLSAVTAMAHEQGFASIKRICEVTRERVGIVRNNLDLIDIGRGAEAQHV